MSIRNAYLLTCNKVSDRTKHCIKILEKVGFNVIIFLAIKHEDKVISNKISMLEIYKKIKDDEKNNWAYVFEDDINLLEKITIDEIIEYENISKNIFYLGLCRMLGKDNKFLRKTNFIIKGHNVYETLGYTRGLHALGLSREGASKLIEFSKKFKNKGNFRYMDVIVEEFTKIYPVNVVRYDLESYIKGHRGIFFQDRKKFPSTI